MLRLPLPQNADDNRYDSQAAGLPVLELVTSSRAVTCELLSVLSSVTCVYPCQALVSQSTL